VDISGIIKGSKDTRVLISTGGQTYEYRTKKVTGKGETYEGIAVDGKSAGSMYAGKIDIISNDRGAGVNTKGDLVSIDDVTITASGDITTNKVHSEKRVAYKTNRKVRIRKQTTAGRQVTVQAKKTEIDVDAKVITGYLEKALGEASFKAEGEEVNNKGEIQAEGRINIKSRLTENSGEMYSTVKTEIEGGKLDNSRGTLKSDGKIDIKTSETVNREGYILSDGLTKEEVKKEEASAGENTGAPKEHGVNISGKLDNTRGVIRGRDITVGGDLVANEKGQIRTSGNVNLNGKNINNAKGEITGNIGKLNAERLINDDGKLTSIDRIEGKIKEISNIRGEILGEEGIRIIGEKLNNFSGVLRSGKNIETELKELNNREGYILKDGITKEEAQKWAVQKVELKESSEETKDNSDKKNTKPSISAERLDNTRGIIASLTGTYIKTSDISNSGGKVVSRNEVVLDMPSDYTYEGLVAGDVSTTISANTVTVNDRLERSDILNLIGRNGVNLREDIAARILTVDTGTSDITNARNIKGEEGVVLKAGNVTNDGNILSGGTLLVNAGGKVYNSATGLMSGKNVHVDAGMIENNRGKILSDGSLSLIAETLIKKGVI